MGPTKVLSEKPLCRSLSSIHILYNQAIVGEMGPLLASARWIANVPLYGGTVSNKAKRKKGLASAPLALLRPLALLATVMGLSIVYNRYINVVR